MLNITDLWNLTISGFAFTFLLFTLRKLDSNIYKKLIELDTKTSLFIKESDWRYEQLSSQFRLISEKLAAFTRRD